MLEETSKYVDVVCFAAKSVGTLTRLCLWLNEQCFRDCRVREKKSPIKTCAPITVFALVPANGIGSDETPFYATESGARLWTLSKSWLFLSFEVYPIPFF